MGYFIDTSQMTVFANTIGIELKSTSTAMFRDFSIGGLGSGAPKSSPLHSRIIRDNMQMRKGVSLRSEIKDRM